MEFVFDRNILDVARAKELRKKAVETGYASFTAEEKAEWDNGLKGTLNYTDLNRIEKNCGTISKMLGMELHVKTNWNMMKVPTVQDFNRIRDNIEALRGSRYIRPDTPKTPTPPLNTYQKINDMEKILFDIYEMYTSNKEAVYYPGELYDYKQLPAIRNKEYYCGEVYADDDFIL